MMTNTATVIDLQAHAARSAADRRARAIEEAMRRHPSFQSRSAVPPPPLRAV
ncbi:hypothetical protein EV589_3046 [Mycobacterium sp. BK558]|nr:hypothetical protein EV589_3046 [Mycobacterium sp. BK558]